MPGTTAVTARDERGAGGEGRAAHGQRQRQRRAALPPLRREPDSASPAPAPPPLPPPSAGLAAAEHRGGGTRPSRPARGAYRLPRPPALPPLTQPASGDREPSAPRHTPPPPPPAPHSHRREGWAAGGGTAAPELPEAAETKGAKQQSGGSGSRAGVDASNHERLGLRLLRCCQRAAGCCCSEDYTVKGAEERLAGLAVQR